MTHHDQHPQNSQFLLYQDDNGVTSVNVRFDGSDVWLAQQQIAQLFDTTRENVVQHIQNILAENELEENRTCKKFLQVRMEGSRSVQRNIPHYSLDMIIVQKTMREWIAKLDGILAHGNRPLLKNAGTVTHKKAIEKATKEFEEYRRKEMLQYESDFDRAVKELTERAANKPDGDAKSQT